MIAAMTSVSTPAEAGVGFATTWLDVSAGMNHTCGVTSTYDLWCWGSNSQGQLGVNDTKNRQAPTRVGAKGKWAAVSAGREHTCGLYRDGTLYCWGANSDGQLGLGSTTRSLTPAKVSSGWMTVDAGETHTCGIDTGFKAYCWGSNRYGAVGEGSDTVVRSPLRISRSGPWMAISAGGNTTCAIDGKDKRYCWGYNSLSALGLGEGKRNTTVISIPTQRSNDGTWRSIDMGVNGGCGVMLANSLWCWGYNGDGKLGVGDTQTRHEPTRVGDFKDWKQVTTGSFHTCGVRSNGQGYCWGANGDGQLGIATTGGSRTTPQSILWKPEEPSLKWRKLAAGGAHTCGITSSGILHCWGRNTYGQLGTNTSKGSFLPAEVA